METLILAAVVFLAGHAGVSSTPVRRWVVRAVGEGPYLGLFSLGAAAALWWLAVEYADAPYVELWRSRPELQRLPAVVMPFALLALVAGVSGPNPSSTGQRVRADADDPARGLVRVTRHPLMGSIALWAAVHVLATGDAASLVFFGAIGVLALGGARLQERRKAAEQGDGWARFAAVTSYVPFVAIAAGRNRLVWGEIGWLRPLVALALYAALLAGGHEWLFGVRPY